MALQYTLIQGGGQGLDQVPAWQDILRAAGWIECTITCWWASVERAVEPSGAVLNAGRSTEAGLEDHVVASSGRSGRSAAHRRQLHVQLRRELGLFGFGPR